MSGIASHAPATSSPSGSTSAERTAVTVVIPTLNEAARIGGAVADLSWADEVIVVDGGSTDDTVNFASRAGARVLCVGDTTIGGQRNAGIATARNRWILALDADERVSPELAQEIRGIASNANPAHAAYAIRFRNQYLGAELRHGPWGKDWHVRLFTRDRRYSDCRVHERLEPIDDVGEGSLSGTIIHQPYRDLPHHLAKIAKYASWAAADFHASGRRAKLSDVTLRPGWRFIRDYVVLSGWRDGVRGLIAAAMSAFSVFLKYASIYTDQRARPM